MEFGLLDGEKRGEHNGISFVEISKISSTQDTFFYRTGPTWQSLAELGQNEQEIRRPL